MQRRLPLILLLIAMSMAFVPVYSISPAVTIQDVSYPSKVRPNERFSVEIIFVCHEVNGWVKAKLYLKQEEMKSHEGTWFGWFGENPDENATLTLSDIALPPSAEPYELEVVMFWTPLFWWFQGDFKQESRLLNIAVVSIVLSVDCLPKSVDANQNFLLQCKITNEGNDSAYDVVAEISEYRDFSPKGELRTSVGSLEPSRSIQVFFNLSSPSVIWGGVHTMALQLTYRDWSNKEYVIPQELSIKVDISPSQFVNTWGLMMLFAIAIVLLVIFAAISRRARVSHKGLVFER